MPTVSAHSPRPSDHGSTTAMATSVSSPSRTPADVTRRMLCGGIAGMVAKTVTNPLERIKMLSQTGEYGGLASASGTKASSQPPSILSIYQSIIQREGILGLWAGNGANLLRIAPSKAVVFSTQDMYKDFFRRLTGATDRKQPLPPIYSFLAGGMAGMTATAATYPLDLARGRISGTLAAAKVTTDAVKGTTAASSSAATTTKAYSGLIQTMVVTVKDEGIAGLYKGITPTILGSMPYVGIQFGTVAVLERLMARRRPIDDTEPSAGGKALRKMILGGVAGVTAGLITYPNDTVRRLLQLQGSRRNVDAVSAVPHFTGYWDCVVQTYRTQGIGRFYRGLTINLIRMAPNTAVQFGTYEFLQQATKSWTVA